MRLFELVDSDRQLLDLIKPILLRAQAEGASSVELQQILNDLDTEDNIDASMLIDVLGRHRDELKNIIKSANLDGIELSQGTKAMSTTIDKQAAKMKSTAAKQALDNLK